MALIRMIVAWNGASDPPRDAMSNTIYFNATNITGIDYQNLVDDVWDVYAATTFVMGRRLDVRAYDMDDGEPRPVKAQKQGIIGGSMTNGDREVALCLSYYGDRNLPRTRGRIYCGPWSAASLGLRPQVLLMNELLTLGEGLAGIGGANVSWRVYSPTSGEDNHIRNIWVNDEWDVVRSRGLRETTRVTRSV